MTVVTGLIPGGEWREAGADVEATLINAETGVAVAGIGSDGAAITTAAGSATGNTWTITLTPNELISTASDVATLWKVERTGKAPSTWIVRVPPSGTYFIGEITTSLGRGYAVGSPYGAWQLLTDYGAAWAAGVGVAGSALPAAGRVEPGGVVRLRGQITHTGTSVADEVICMLPSGLRPSGSLELAAFTNSSGTTYSVTTIVIASSGAMTFPRAAANLRIVLDAITYSVAV